MPLQPGTCLGPYEIAAQIGVGGIGEVCKATDTNLKRSVALKVVPASVVADVDRLARFQREAEVLAALNHPNIAAIYGLGRSGATTALVMELVEGGTLTKVSAGIVFPKRLWRPETKRTPYVRSCLLSISAVPCGSRRDEPSLPTSQAYRANAETPAGLT